MSTPTPETAPDLNGNGAKNTTIPDDYYNLLGYDVNPYKWLNWNSISPVLAYTSAVAMVVGCVLPYVPQYLTIHKTHNSAGFSTLVCLALLVANITRISFWFGRFFDIALLVQSAVMIIAQLMLLEICVRVKRCNYNWTKEKTLFNSHIRYFWAWSNLLSYIEFLIIFSIIIGTSTYFYKGNIYFVEIMGYSSLLIESMLAMPQLIKNFKKKSVVGLSVGMVLMWALGDTFKTAYFIYNSQPFQFWLCGMLQITIDILIMIQICVFSQGKYQRNSSLPMKNLVST